MRILPHPVVGQLLCELPLQEAVREQTLSLCLMGLFGINVWGNFQGECVEEMSENFTWEMYWRKVWKFLWWEFMGIFRGNVRECLEILGAFPRENWPKENVSGTVWGIIRKILPGMFSGKCMAVSGEFSEGICLLKMSKRMWGNFLGEISQGNVWGSSGKDGRNVT